MPHPYTHAELEEMKRKVSQNISKLEREYPDARPLPPLDEDEAKEFLQSFFDTAEIRILTSAETFLMGQLLAAYNMAVEARMLGRKGRYFVISEEQLDALQKRKGGWK